MLFDRLSNSFIFFNMRAQASVIISWLHCAGDIGMVFSSWYNTSMFTTVGMQDTKLSSNSLNKLKATQINEHFNSI